MMGASLSVADDIGVLPTMFRRHAETMALLRDYQRCCQFHRLRTTPTHVTHTTHESHVITQAAHGLCDDLYKDLLMFLAPVGS
jgi:hypothetical protein